MSEYRFLLALLLSLFAHLAYADNEQVSNCSENAVNTYERYREALLSNNFNTNDVKNLCGPDVLKNIVPGREERYFMSMRVTEAKVTNILAYQTTCSKDGSHATLKLKTKNFDESYNRRRVDIRWKGGKYYVFSTSDEDNFPLFDVDVTYTDWPRK